MTDQRQTDELEHVLAQFRRPLKNLPFPLVIKAMAGQEVLPIKRDDPDDRELLACLARAAQATAESVRAAPIRRNRPNEVGNDIEPHAMEAIRRCGLCAERPRSRAGRGQQTGYPDILVYDRAGRPTYVECKIFGEGSTFTTMRSFYLSPSENFKVCLDARHVLLAFAVDREPIPGSRDSWYRATEFKILDLFHLQCDVKYEFNSDNRRLYAANMILAGGPV
jgi:hypothetical protein